MQENTVTKVMKEWKDNTHKLSIGIDDWAAEYETLSSKIKEDIFIKNEDGIVKLMLDHDLSAAQMGAIITHAWSIGRISEKLVEKYNPKSSMRIGGGDTTNLIVQRMKAQKDIEGKEYVYPKYIGTPTYNNQATDETQIANVKFYAEADSSQGIERALYFLQGPIITQITNRLTALKCADEDFEGEAKKLKKKIDGIVKELK